MPEQECECCGGEFFSAYVRLLCGPCRRGGCSAFDDTRVCTADNGTAFSIIRDDG